MASRSMEAVGKLPLSLSLRSDGDWTVVPKSRLGNWARDCQEDPKCGVKKKWWKSMAMIGADGRMQSERM